MSAMSAIDPDRFPLGKRLGCNYQHADVVGLHHGDARQVNFSLLHCWAKLPSMTRSRSALHF
jgi:hypothetical protein